MNLEQRKKNYELIIKVEALLAFAEKTTDKEEIARLKALLSEFVSEV